MKQIELEDIATVFAGELIKEITHLSPKDLYMDNDEKQEKSIRIVYPDFIKMSYPRRRKVVERVLDKMLGDAK
jgi:stress-induced morphogen